MAEIEKNSPVVAPPSGSCGEVEGRDQGASFGPDHSAEPEPLTGFSPSGECSSRTPTSPVEILYTNWRGETAVRRIVPWSFFGPNPWRFGATQWHPEPQWLLSAVDADKDQRRDFALSGIRAWGAEAVAAAQAMEARQGGYAEGGSVVDDSAVTEGDVPASIVQSSPTPPGDLIQAAYDLGFAASGEGWSGEWPSGVTEKLSYQLRRAEELRALHRQEKVEDRPEGWEPIETAPQDGTWIETCRIGEPDPSFCGVLHYGYAEPPETAWWCIHGDRWQPAQRPHDFWHPTHWRPLPASPRPSHERQG